MTSITTTNEDKIVKMTIAVPKEFRNEAKIHAINNSQKLRDYIMKAVLKQMEQDNNKRQLNRKTLKGLKQSLKEEESGTLKRYKNAKELIDDVC